MKYTVVSFLFLILSCSNQDDLVFDGNTDQEWRLVSISGFNGSVTEGEEMEWQETYRFAEDGTFTKTRTANGETLFGSGRFDLAEANNEQLVELAYSEANAIVGSCFGQESETLILDDNKARLRSTWQACDGPGLIYERVD